MEIKSLRKRIYLPVLFLSLVLISVATMSINFISGYPSNGVKATYILLVVLVSAFLLVFFWKYFGKIENEIYGTQGMNESILSAITSPMVLLDLNYNIKNLNRYAEQFIKKEPDSLNKKNLFERNLPWDKNEVHKIFEAIKKSHKPLKGHEIVFSKDRTMGISVYPINDSQGKISGFLLMGSDITDKKKYENKKNIEQKLVSLGELSAGVAHEINTPSQYIISNLDFLKRSMEDVRDLYKKLVTFLNCYKSGNILKKKQLNGLSEYISTKEIDYLFSEIPGAINQSLEGMDRITKIVKSMKSLARHDGGEKIQVNINDIIEDVITISRNEWKYSAQLKSDLDYNLQEIVCNPVEINQVILELIMNSTYAISQKIKTGTYEKGVIEISTCREDGMAMITVKDDGTGIPDEVKNRVFDPFFTTRDVGEGTGSGLSYVYTAVVRSHGGSIDINSGEKGGTEFIIRLPVSGHNNGIEQ